MANERKNNSKNNDLSINDMRRSNRRGYANPQRGSAYRSSGKNNPSGDDDLIFPNGSHTVKAPENNTDEREAAPSSVPIHRRRSSGIYYRDNVIQDDESSMRGRRKSKEDDLSANSINAGGFSHESHRKRANIRELLKLLASMLLITAMIFGLIAFYQKLHVKSIAIIGSYKYSEKQLLSKSGLQDGAFLLSYNRKDIDDLFNKIDDVTVLDFKRVFPDRLEIRVVDKDARAAILTGNGKYTIISADGYVISSGAESADELIVIRGLSGKSYAVGSYIDESTQDASELADFELLEGFNASELADMITAIDLSNTSCVKFEIADEFTIVLGDCIEAPNNIETASKAYVILSKRYPAGGIINVFSDSTIIDFSPTLSASIDEPTAQPADNPE